jgi:hypothetical protein
MDVVVDAMSRDDLVPSNMASATRTSLSISLSSYVLFERRARLSRAASSYLHSMPREEQLEQAGRVVSHRILARVHASQHLLRDVGRPTGRERQ